MVGQTSVGEILLLLSRWFVVQMSYWSCDCCSSFCLFCSLRWLVGSLVRLLVRWWRVCFRFFSSGWLIFVWRQAKVRCPVLFFVRLIGDKVMPVINCSLYIQLRSEENGSLLYYN